MNTLLVALIAMLGCLNSWGQSRLSACTGTNMALWSNCAGAVDMTNGDKYQGEFMNGRFQGRGTYTYADGGRYTGQWRDNKRSGKGMYTGPRGAKYVGEFENDLANGYGTFTYEDGSQYIGEFKDDSIHGSGTYVLANGDKYIGSFKNDTFHGNGAYIFSNGEKLVGEWVNNQLVSQVNRYSANGTLIKQSNDSGMSLGEFLRRTAEGFKAANDIVNSSRPRANCTSTPLAAGGFSTTCY